MKTRSAYFSRLSGLDDKTRSPFSPVCKRFGPRVKCRGDEEAPGPPLNKNTRGRRPAGSVSTVYEVADITAAGQPVSSSRYNGVQRALYSSFLPSASRRASASTACKSCASSWAHRPASPALPCVASPNNRENDMLSRNVPDNLFIVIPHRNPVPETD